MKMKLKVQTLNAIFAVIFFTFMGCNKTQDGSCKNNEENEKKWTTAKAVEWQNQNGWLVGCNYIPATAVNQLEMWQKESFDAATINNELKLASETGFNIIRVFLHDLLWDADSLGFVERIKTFISIADKYKIKTMLVFFDDCWYGNAQLGKQPNPIIGIHNSGWLQSPRYADVMNKNEWKRLERYVKGIMTKFKDDQRIALWDLYNEPANNHTPSQVFPLLKEVFQWARNVNPTQPLTVCVWKEGESYNELIAYCIAQSDIISYHNYSDYEGMAKQISNLKSFGKPLLCSEYLARGYKSTFETILPLMKKENVAAINWGFVDGKTQTKYYWNHPLNDTIIDPWHHEIYRKDLKPYKQSEVDLIKELTGKK